MKNNKKIIIKINIKVELRRLLYLSLWFPLLVASQNEQGIQFEKELSWKQIKAKAKSENKYIFVDCYASWCGPCKAMDEQVYPQKEVGDYYNAHFVSVKVQIDKTSKDDDQIKRWYIDAAVLQLNYSINAFPTFLFFSPDGLPLHKVVGALGAKDFVSLAKDAQDSSKQYYSVLKNYQPGKLDTSELRGLTKLFSIGNNKDLAEKMFSDYFSRIPLSNWGDSVNLKFMGDLYYLDGAKQVALRYLNLIPATEFSSQNNLRLINANKNDSAIQNLLYAYLKQLSNNELKQQGNFKLISIFKNDANFKILAANYINGLTEKESLTKENILFMRNFINNSSDKAFKIFYNNSEKINTIMDQKYYAEQSVDEVITKEEVNPLVEVAKKSLSEPDWNKIQGDIATKYGKDYAKLNVLAAKPGFYADMKKWSEYAKYLVQFVDNYTPIKTTSAFYLNNMAWEVFENTSDKHDLERANYWMEVALKSDTTSPYYDGYLDTKANIVYRLGKKKEAITLEERSIEMGYRKDGKAPDWVDTLNKMKRGENTWPDKSKE